LAGRRLRSRRRIVTVAAIRAGSDSEIRVRKAVGKPGGSSLRRRSPTPGPGRLGAGSGIRARRVGPGRQLADRIRWSRGALAGAGTPTDRRGGRYRLRLRSCSSGRIRVQARDIGNLPRHRPRARPLPVITSRQHRAINRLRLRIRIPAVAEVGIPPVAVGIRTAAVAAVITAGSKRSLSLFQSLEPGLRVRLVFFGGSPWRLLD
jgi:hypothetical protein